jgi:hypothetical protein
MASTLAAKAEQQTIDSSTALDVAQPKKDVIAKVRDSQGNVTEQAIVFNEDNPRAMRLAMLPPMRPRPTMPICCSMRSPRVTSKSPAMVACGRRPHKPRGWPPHQDRAGA